MHDVWKERKITVKPYRHSHSYHFHPLQGQVTINITYREEICYIPKHVLSYLAEVFSEVDFLTSANFLLHYTADCLLELMAGARFY